MGNRLKKSAFALPAESVNTMSKSYPDRRTAERCKRAAAERRNARFRTKGTS